MIPLYNILISNLPYFNVFNEHSILKVNYFNCLIALITIQ